MSTATATLSPSATRGGEPLDTTVRLVTPERIAFRYPLAGPFRRALAYLLDWLVWLVLLIAAATTSMLLSLGFSPGLGLFLVLLFILQWSYGAAFEALWNGQTPGKRACGLRVVTAEGTPILGWQAVV